jgi:hypothetical protein
MTKTPGQMVPCHHHVRGIMPSTPLVYYQLVILALIWLCVMRLPLWPSPSRGMPPRPAAPIKPKRRRSSAPNPFAGLTQQPHCALCEGETGERTPAPPRRLDPMRSTNRRPRTVDLSLPFCPPLNCYDRGGLGRHNLRTQVPPSGGPWRQVPCLGCHGVFPPHPGTLWHGQQAAVERLVHGLAGLAEGRGIRATARVLLPPTPYWTGWWKRRSRALAFLRLSCVISTSNRYNSMRCIPCSAPSRRASSRRPRPSSACLAPRTGSGWPSIP